MRFPGKNFLLLIGVFVLSSMAGAQTSEADEAELVIKRAVEYVGGEKYLNVRSQVGRGRYSVLQNGLIASFQSFHDVLVYPDKERTEFKAGKSRRVQVNVGDKGWVYDGDFDVIKEQTEEQVELFSRGIRSSMDTLLRGHWRGKGRIEYVGKRAASLGKRNDVLRLTYVDGLIVEFEIGADDGMPVKAIQRRTNADGEELTEEDRYAQFVSVGGIKSPFIIDRFINGVHKARINYESVEYNQTVDDGIFGKPSDVKELKRSLQL